MKELILKVLTSGTLRRILAVVVGLAIVPLNRRLGLNIPTEEVVSALVLLGTYIAQSAWKEGSVAKAEAAGEKKAAAAPPAPALQDGAVDGRTLAK